MNLSEESILFHKIQKGDEKAFEILFHKYYNYLCAYAVKIIQDDDVAEEIVQGFFVKLWDKKEQISIETSVKNYLFRSIKNLCLNSIQHNAVKIHHAQSVLADAKNNASKVDTFFEIDLAKNIENSIQSLPEKRREIFRLSREDGLKYREIAEKLNISIKTVESQMSLAIKFLRDKLKKYNTFFTFFLYFHNK